LAGAKEKVSTHFSSAVGEGSAAPGRLRTFWHKPSVLPGFGLPIGAYPGSTAVLVVLLRWGNWILKSSGIYGGTQVLGDGNRAARGGLPYSAEFRCVVCRDSERHLVFRRLGVVGAGRREFPGENGLWTAWWICRSHLPKRWRGIALRRF